MMVEQKHYGRYYAIVIADGHLAEFPTKFVYFRVVWLGELRVWFFLGESNEMTAWGTDISSTYYVPKCSRKSELTLVLSLVN